MLQKINENLVIDRDAGIEIRIRIPLWYFEVSSGERVARVSIESVGASPRLAVYTESLTEWTTPAETPISSDDRDHIFHWISGSLQLLNCPHEIV